MNINAFGNMSRTPNGNRTVVVYLEDCERPCLRSKFLFNVCGGDKGLTSWFVSVGKTGFIFTSIISQGISQFSVVDIVSVGNVGRINDHVSTEG